MKPRDVRPAQERDRRVLLVVIVAGYLLAGTALVLALAHGW